MTIDVKKCQLTLDVPNTIYPKKISPKNYFNFNKTQNVRTKIKPNFYHLLTLKKTTESWHRVIIIYLQVYGPSFSL